MAHICRLIMQALLLLYSSLNSIKLSVTLLPILITSLQKYTLYQVQNVRMARLCCVVCNIPMQAACALHISSLFAYLLMSIQIVCAFSHSVPPGFPNFVIVEIYAKSSKHHYWFSADLGQDMLGYVTITHIWAKPSSIQIHRT